MKNRELYETRYRIKGLKPNLKKIFALADKRKILQLKTEAMRAECNKLCGLVAELRNNQKDTNTTLSKIRALDKQIAINMSVLDWQNEHINKLLSKLHNLPDHENLRHLQLKTDKNMSSLVDLDEFLNNIAAIETSNKTIDKYLKSQENAILSELPKIVKCKKGYTILTTLNDFENTKTKIFEYLKKHSQHIIEVSCKKLYKSNTASYLVHLNRHSSIYLEVIREYKTREHKIKYHAPEIDMTRFVNQMNIIFKVI